MVVLTGSGEIVADEVVVCGGLQSARLAVMAGDDPEPAIIPFRGEYYRIAQEHAHLVNGLVYPVPDPRYPFLGIHLTRRIDGTVDIGPNAVLAFALEGYQRADISGLRPGGGAADAGLPQARQDPLADRAEGDCRLGQQADIPRSGPQVPARARAHRPRAGPGGVRAQAIKNDGQLVDDFWITRRQRSATLVRNAPSPPRRHRWRSPNTSPGRCWRVCRAERGPSWVALSSVPGRGMRDTSPELESAPSGSRPPGP